MGILQGPNSFSLGLNCLAQGFAFFLCQRPLCPQCAFSQARRNSCWVHESCCFCLLRKHFVLFLLLL